MINLRWGILGPGNIAADFAKALQAVNGGVYAVGARSLAKAEAFAGQYAVEKVYSSYDELLKDEALDIVYLATPHSHHYEYIMRSLEQGKHVLCEKAITVNSRQLQEAAALAKKKNLILAEAMTIYYMPLYVKLRQIVQSGQIGRLKMIQVSFGSCKEYDVANRFFSKELAGGALLDIGTYALSFARYFLSAPPQEILTTMKPFETGVDEQSGIILKNNRDEMAVVALTMRAKMPKRGVVAGETGFITVDNFPRADRAVIQYLDGRSEVVADGDTEQALAYEVAAISQCVARGEGGYLDLSLDVMNIMDEVRRQWNIQYPFE